MAEDEKKHTTSLYERLAANPELVKLFQHEKGAREAREAVNEVWKKAEVSSSIKRTPVDRTAPKALTNDRSEPPPTAAATDRSNDDRPLIAAIRTRLNRGDRPGSTVKWDKFCQDIRKDCDAFIGNPKNEEFKRGFSDDTIKRVAREEMRRK